ncbi:MAG: alanyl-tRNA editing protein, partial [Candidatus Kariarchaeaceae archaeon]
MEKTEQVYARDAYTTQLDATVVDVKPEGIILDRTIFYPQGGGQPSDQGKLISGGSEIPIVALKKQGNVVLHQIDGDVQVGDDVQCEVDWDYRYKLMKHHTALHILSAVVWDETQAKVTGGTIYENKARLDFDLIEFNKEMAAGFVEKTNQL